MSRLADEYYSLEYAKSANELLNTQTVRTCTNLSVMPYIFNCSECGFVDTNIGNFCPNCGAKITKEDTSEAGGNHGM